MFLLIISLIILHFSVAFRQPRLIRQNKLQLNQDNISIEPISQDVIYDKFDDTGNSSIWSCDVTQVSYTENSLTSSSSH